MRRRSSLLVASTVLGLACAGAAFAGTLNDGSYTITATNAQLTTSYGGASTFANTVTFAGYGGSVVTPVATITGGALNPGGSTNPDSGIDNSIANYISAYSGNSITIAFDANQKYFGLLWGSPDVSNTISLYEGATLLATYTGAGLEGNAVGLEPYPAAGSFVDFVADNAGTYFDKVVISENASYFEVDNLASLAAPEPAAWALLMLGVGMVGFSLRTTRDRRAGVA